MNKKTLISIISVIIALLALLFGDNLIGRLLNISNDNKEVLIKDEEVVRPNEVPSNAESLKPNILEFSNKKIQEEHISQEIKKKNTVQIDVKEEKSVQVFEPNKEIRSVNSNERTFKIHEITLDDKENKMFWNVSYFNNTDKEVAMQVYSSSYICDEYGNTYNIKTTNKNGKNVVSEDIMARTRKRYIMEMIYPKQAAKKFTVILKSPYYKAMNIPIFKINLPDSLNLAFKKPNIDVDEGEIIINKKVESASSDKVSLEIRTIKLEDEFMRVYFVLRNEGGGKSGIQITSNATITNSNGDSFAVVRDTRGIFSKNFFTELESFSNKKYWIEFQRPKELEPGNYNFVFDSPYYASAKFKPVKFKIVNE